MACKEKGGEEEAEVDGGEVEEAVEEGREGGGRTNDVQDLSRTYGLFRRGNIGREKERETRSFDIC